MADEISTNSQPAAPVSAPLLDLGALLNLVSGFKTSEFWFLIAASVGGLLAKLGVLCSGASCSPGAFSDQDFAVLVGGGLFYAFGRFFLKNKNQTLNAALQQMLNQVSPPKA